MPPPRLPLVCLLFLGFGSLLQAAQPATQTPAAPPAPAQPAAPDTRVILLGSGTPIVDPDRMGPAVAIVTGEQVYLVDCGAGIVRRAVQAGLRTAQLTRVFVTHLHSDHTTGLPDLMFTPEVVGRPAGLELFGPPGLERMVRLVREAWSEDLDIRLHGGEPLKSNSYTFHARDLKAGEIYKDDFIRVTAIEVPHGKWPHAFGYKFEAKDKVIVVSGDTTYSEKLLEAAKGCDILVHEVYAKQGLDRMSAAWQAYHSTYHTSAADVGKVATLAKAKKVVLYHQLLLGATAEQLLTEVRSTYSGEVIYGKDLDVVR
jgi:ribonuclease BN (tRNA processing enzyme)